MKRSFRVLVLDMQPITPAVGGGRLRLLGLYHALGPHLPTTYVGTYDWPGESRRDLQLTPTLREVLIPLSSEHFAAHDELQRQVGRVVIDTAFHQQAHHSPDFLNRVFDELPHADIVICSHPWLHPLIRNRVESRQLLVYDSHNVEGFLRLQLLGNTAAGNRVAEEVIRVERELCDAADLVLCCSQEDASLFRSSYGTPEAKLRVAPNGVFTSKIAPASEERKRALRNKLGVFHPNAAIFIGSPYDPNLQAARFIVEHIAPQIPSTLFVIAGGVGDTLSNSAPPYSLNSNVYVTGRLTDEERLDWLQCADIAVNPMFSGSGTNIKMFDFFAAGLPVVSTETGARGIEQNMCLQVAGRDEFPTATRELLAMPGVVRGLATEARHLAERRYSWEAVSSLTGALIAKRFAEQSRSAPNISFVLPPHWSDDKCQQARQELIDSASGDYELLRVRSTTAAGFEGNLSEGNYTEIGIVAPDNPALLEAAAILASGAFVCYMLERPTAESVRAVTENPAASRSSHFVPFEANALRRSPIFAPANTWEQRRSIPLEDLLGLSTEEFQSRVLALWPLHSVRQETTAPPLGFLEDAIKAHVVDTQGWRLDPVIPDVFSSTSRSLFVAEELMRHDGDDFVITVYRELLRRDPDAEAMRYYRWALQNNRIQKQDLIATVSSSEEAAQYSLRIVSLDEVRAENSHFAELYEA